MFQYITSTLIGVLFAKHNKNGIISVALLSLTIAFISLKVIPNDLENSLTVKRYDKLPEFTIHKVNGEKIQSKSLKGKIVVLDFFGTWCKPCILELKELEKIKATFNEEDVEFIIMNADQGGDTPEKFKAFINKSNYTFEYAYDHDSKIFKQLKLAHLGLPTLLIIDKNQNIRLQHVGYNTAETNFTKHMIEFINELK